MNETELTQLITTTIGRRATTVDREAELLNQLDDELKADDSFLLQRLDEITNSHARRRLRIAEAARTLADRIGRLPVASVEEQFELPRIFAGKG